MCGLSPGITCAVYAAGLMRGKRLHFLRIFNALAFQAEDILVGLGPDFGLEHCVWAKGVEPKGRTMEALPRSRGAAAGVSALKVDGEMFGSGGIPSSLWLIRPRTKC